MSLWKNVYLRGGGGGGSFLMGVVCVHMDYLCKEEGAVLNFAYEAVLLLKKMVEIRQYGKKGYFFLKPKPVAIF